MIVWFAFDGSFFITDLRENKEDQEENLWVLLEDIIFHGKELNLVNEWV